MAEQTRSHCVYPLGEGLELWKCHIDDLREQTKNARTMTPKMFKRLAETIGKAKRLEQLPFAALRRDGERDRLELISGHHRVRASRTANVLHIFVLVDVTGLSRGDVVAKQLSHNAIMGQDDPDILAQLFEELENIDQMMESAVDPEALTIANTMPPVSIDAVTVDAEIKTMTIIFLPSQVNDLDRVCQYVKALIGDEAAVAQRDQYDQFVHTIQRLGAKEDIRAIGSILAKMIEITERYLEAVATNETPEAATVPEPVREKVKEVLSNRRPATRALEALKRAQKAAESAETVAE